MKDVCVLGLGYIGFPTAVMLASHGKRVVGIDTNQNLISKVSVGELTFQEKGLGKLFSTAIANGICFESSCVSAQIYIVAVPTPFDKNTKRIDPSHVITAINNVLDVCPKGSIIVIESTVSPGTIDKFVRPVIKQRSFVTGENIHLAHAPERIIPGRMICELRENDRVIGADSLEIAEKVRDMYTSFCERSEETRLNSSH